MSEASLGRDTPRVAGKYDILGAILLRQGDPAAAHAAAQHAIAIRRRAHGEATPSYGVSLAYDAQHLLALGRHDEARTVVREALATDRKTVGERHPNYAEALGVEGRILLAQGDARAAIPRFEQAVAILSAAVGEAGLPLCAALNGLADAQLAVGDARSALATAERAVAIATHAPPGELAAAQVRLAKARHALGEPGALALARDVRARLASLPFPAEDLPDLDAWLARVRR